MPTEPYRTPAPPSERRESNVRCARCGFRSERFTMFGTADGDICESCFGQWRAAVSLRASDVRTMRSYTWQLVWAAVSGLWFFLMLATPARYDDGKEHRSGGGNVVFIAGTALLAWKLWRLRKRG